LIRAAERRDAIIPQFKVAALAIGASRSGDERGRYHQILFWRRGILPIANLLCCGFFCGAVSIALAGCRVEPADQRRRLWRGAICRLAATKSVYNTNHSHLLIGASGTRLVSLTLSDLPHGQPATVSAVRDLGPADSIAARLRDLGFVSGEAVRIVARGPVGADPLLVQIGFTRFALRRAEAARVLVETSVEAGIETGVPA
jgi:ferrous iron transport protein A